jgi:hypothetical protein
MRTLRSLVMATVVILAAGTQGCSCGNSGGAGDGGNGDASVGDLFGAGDGPIQVIDGGVSITDDGGTFTCYQTLCNGKLLECGDCADNDGDGYVDFRDKECLGPCDNTEGPALTAGIGGETGGPCKADCYFDFGNGPGNDDCHWDHRCDPLSIAPDFPPEGPGCALVQSMVGGKDCPAKQSQMCLDMCRPVTPNGCDCFGCCTFPEIPGKFVWIGSMDESNNGTCTFADITDPAKCEPCTPVKDCFNDCGTCELCLGKTTLPPECFPPADGGVVGTDMGPPPRCPNGEQVCGLPGEPVCPQDYYCITGCCVATIF